MHNVESQNHSNEIGTKSSLLMTIKDDRGNVLSTIHINDNRKDRRNAIYVNIEDDVTRNQDVKETVVSSDDDDDDENVLDSFEYFIDCGTDKRDGLSVHSNEFRPIFHGKNRGVVYYKNELFLKEFSRSIRVTDVKKLDTIFRDGVYYSKALEGSVIRVFYVNDKWYTTCRRKLDVFNTSKHSMIMSSRKKDILLENINSKLSVFKDYVETEPKSFGERFEAFVLKSFPDARKLEDVYERKLDKNKKYVFMLLSNEDDRYVCRNPPGVKLLGVFDKYNKVELNVKIDGFDTHEYKPLTCKRHVDEAKNLFENDLTVDRYQGLCVVDLNDTDMMLKTYKLYLDDYTRLRELRTDDIDEDLVRCYVKLRRSNDEKLCDFFTIFPFMRSKAVIFEEGCRRIAQHLQSYYYMAYMKPQDYRDSNLECMMLMYYSGEAKHIHRRCQMQKIEPTVSNIVDILCEYPQPLLNMMNWIFVESRIFDDLNQWFMSVPVHPFLS